MLPLRLVLDTNIVVSAALKPEGLERFVFGFAITPPAALYISGEIAEEYGDVLGRRRLRIPDADRRELMQLIRLRAKRVTPRRKVHECVDPDDNVFLECAESARADYLITGNLRHFPSHWLATKVVTSRQFLAIVAPHLLA